MQIHGMCLIKNESDVICEAIRAAINWCDFIYVYDNGSDDGTWEKLQELATECSQIVLYKQDGKPFSDGLRAEIYNNYRARSSPGDWWCRLDADEFYIDDPRVFLAKVPPEYKAVMSASFSYYLTDQDAALYRQTPSLYADDVPVEQKCRYYLNHWSEIRFFRYAPDLEWKSGGWPAAILQAAVYDVRIWVKHFAYRSPQQIEKRLQTRQSAISQGEFIHEAIPNWGEAIGSIRDDLTRGLKSAGSKHAGTKWEQRVVDASKLNYDAHDRRYVVNEDLMPAIPTARLPELAFSLGRIFSLAVVQRISARYARAQRLAGRIIPKLRSKLKT